MKNLRKKTENSLRIAISELQDQDYEVRMKAVEKLGQLFEGKSPPPALVGMLEDKDELVRIAAAESLSKTGDRKVLPALWERISDSSPLVRCYIAQAIGQLGGGQDAEKLEARLNEEKDQASRIGIYEALYRLGHDRYLLSIFDLLKSKNYRVRCAAANTISYLLDDRYAAQVSLNVLQETLRQETTIAAKSSMQSAIKIVSRYLNSLRKQGAKSKNQKAR